MKLLTFPRPGKTLFIRPFQNSQAAQAAELRIRLKETESDLILTKNVVHCQNNEIWIQQILDMEFYHSYNADSFDWLGNRTHNYLLHHCCTYKTRVLRQFLPGLFLENQPYDDLVLAPSAMIGCNSIEAFDFVLYHYLLDRPGQSMSLEVKMHNQMAMIKSQQHTIEFYEKHPVGGNKTKELYVAKKVPKMYVSKYKELVSFQYKDGRKFLKMWDLWVRQTNPKVRSSLIMAYRCLPFFIYRPVCLLGFKILSKYRRKDVETTRYIKG